LNGYNIIQNGEFDENFDLPSDMMISYSLINRQDPEEGLRLRFTSKNIEAKELNQI